MPTEAIASLVRNAFAGTADDRVVALANRWHTPLSVNLVLDLLQRNGHTSGNAITATDQVIAGVPRDLAGIYDQQFALLPEPARIAVIWDVICGADPSTADDFGDGPGKDATWAAVNPEWVLAAGKQAPGLEATPIDHQTAVETGWVRDKQGWLEFREPGLAASAWRAITIHGMEPHAHTIRRNAAKILAQAINAACQQPDGTPGLFLREDRPSKWSRPG